jgi:hypothetical protein
MPEPGCLLRDIGTDLDDGYLIGRIGLRIVGEPPFDLPAPLQEGARIDWAETGYGEYARLIDIGCGLYTVRGERRLFGRSDAVDLDSPDKEAVQIVSELAFPTLRLVLGKPIGFFFGKALIVSPGFDEGGLERPYPVDAAPLLPVPKRGIPLRLGGEKLVSKGRAVDPARTEHEAESYQSHRKEKEFGGCE